MEFSGSLEIEENCCLKQGLNQVLVVMEWLQQKNSKQSYVSFNESENSFASPQSPETRLGQKENINSSTSYRKNLTQKMQ